MKKITISSLQRCQMSDLIRKQISRFMIRKKDFYLFHFKQKKVNIILFNNNNSTLFTLFLSLHRVFRIYSQEFNKC